jgi:large conductance mechanosensitive channel
MLRLWRLSAKGSGLQGNVVAWLQTMTYPSGDPFIQGVDMSIASEFKEFAMKGNVVDMAVGVIIGAAFGKIVSSLVENVIMPPLGVALSGVSFSDMGSQIGAAPDGTPVLLKYGAFFQTIFDFVIIAFVLFLALKGINKLKKPAPAPTAAPAPPPRNEVLLEEIRDLLKK